MNLAGKIGVVSISSLGILATGWGAHRWMSQPTNMKEKFQSLKIQILDKSADSIWTQLVSKYKEAQSSGGESSEKPKKIEGLDLTDPDTPEGKHKKELQQKCEGLLKTSLKDANYQKREQEAKWWCISSPEALSN